MKSGTNTLYHDMLRNPSLFLPDKDLNPLVHDVSPREYANYFHAARSSQLCGDVSTCYSMLPTYPGVVQRARNLLPQGTKIVYIVREPLRRLISHHYHMSVRRGAERMPRDIDRCVREFPALIAYSRYAMQLEPWLDSFGREAVHVIRFEDYVSDRRQQLKELCEFLGVHPTVDGIDPERIHNQSDGKPVLNTFWSVMTSTAAYRRIIRPLFPLRLRDRIRSVLLPKAPSRPDPPSPETVDFIIDQLKPDIERLRQMLGHDEPFWNLEAVRQRVRPVSRLRCA